MINCIAGRKIRLTDDLGAIDRLTLCLAEFFGTGILMSIGCLGCVHYDVLSQRSLIESAFAFGFAVLMAIQCFGHISGAHLNPIITLAAVITGLLPVVEVPFYLIGQFLGSIAGFGLVKLLVPPYLIYGGGQEKDGICAVGLNPAITPVSGLFIEVCISSILVTVALSIWDDRNQYNKDTVPIRFGFTIAVIVASTGGFTSAHMNPARTLGPSLLNGYWENHWIFWIGPFTGSFVASVLYVTLFD